ncbi:unnamed protein product [Menidia menidia]|uniref:(Atlantic silverside) hypothetical protein n=1 Tax=Menidia menidia TaxID=238744 RepID=A0A8S4ABC5_9TELE|nr:unnamed protein product [Menidia menidia]
MESLTASLYLDVMGDSSAIITQMRRNDEENAPRREGGSSEVAASKKPHSRGLLSSLLCCLCHKDTVFPSAKNKNNAPLLVEENGSGSKVGPSLAPLRGVCFLPSPPRSSSRTACGQHNCQLSDE